MIDGGDHINIYSKGLTPLGRALSNFTKAPITTLDGGFQSIEGYWYWLNSQHADRDKLRNLYGWEAKKVGRELDSGDWNNDSIFKLKIIHAMVMKLVEHPAILTLFKENFLPFRHYYVYGGKTVEPKEGQWIVEFWEYLRKHL